jgi:hypothetical protein
MKTRYLYIALLSLIITSCKKDRNKADTDNGAMQKITFKASFTQTKKTIKTTSLANNSVPDTALTNHIQVLYYMVFDAAGNRVHNITQKSTDPNFGSYTDNLHAGVYTVAIGGGSSNLQISDGTLSQQQLRYFDGEFYFAKDTISVGNTDLNKPMTLNRISSKLSIVIKDAIPVGGKYLWVQCNNFGDRFNIGTATAAIGSYVEFRDNNLIAGHTNYTINTTFLYAGPFSLTISVSDALYDRVDAYNFTPFGSKTIRNIPGAQNSVITLTGNMFGGLPGDNGTTVKADTVWKTPIVKPF